MTQRLALANRVEVTVPAPITAVWDVMSDVTRVGEWSQECIGAAWVEGCTRAEPGARFRGRNRAGALRWGRLCEIERAEPYELVWVTIVRRLYRDSSRWRITLTEVAGETQITQEYEMLHAPKILQILFAYLVPAHRDRTAALIGDLTRLGEVAARSAARA